ncbi:DUF5133 domain-containing protein [Streptacidiphilus carbonis]|uniref:DUF5133 domain-containing protein n=1 Tax=Streptacidiphilus carbonis TaxID=105422 RepID=UPI0005AA3348|nr:DUF5133 domain-containing protein [Streptacidiphilus carbonis]
MAALLNLPELRRLVAELDALDGALFPGAGRRREDLHYTVCVSTGLRDPHQAVERARQLVAEAAPPATT